MFKQYKYEEAAEEDTGGGGSATETETSTEKTETTTETTEEKAAVMQWPENWKEQLADGDEKNLKRFDRYADPKAFGKAFIATQNKLRSGELVQILPDDPSEEQLADYRKSNGIPEKPEGYDINLGEGRVFGDDDKETVDRFLTAAHTANMSPAQVNAALNAHFDNLESAAEVRAELDLSDRETCQETLIADWGVELKRNLNAVSNALDAHMDQDTKELFLNARLADGTAMFNNADAVKALVGLVLEANPMATVVPGGTGDKMQSIESEIAAIEEKMRKDRPAYNSDEKLQERYRALLTARDKAK